MLTPLLVAVAIASASPPVTPINPGNNTATVAQNFNACMARCQAKGRPFKVCVQICG